MKKLIFLCVLTLVFSFTGVFGDVAEYDIEFTEGWGWDLETGEYGEHPYWSSSNRVYIKDKDNVEITFNSNAGFHHILWFNSKNKLVSVENINEGSYYNMNRGNDTFTHDIGFDELTVTHYDPYGGLFPDYWDIASFVIQAYNYTPELTLGILGDVDGDTINIVDASDPYSINNHGATNTYDEPSRTWSIVSNATGDREISDVKFFFRAIEHPSYVYVEPNTYYTMSFDYNCIDVPVGSYYDGCYFQYYSTEIPLTTVVFDEGESGHYSLTLDSGVSGSLRYYFGFEVSLTDGVGHLEVSDIKMEQGMAETPYTEYGESYSIENIVPNPSFNNPVAPLYSDANSGLYWNSSGGIDVSFASTRATVESNASYDDTNGNFSNTSVTLEAGSTYFYSVFVENKTINLDLYLQFGSDSADSVLLDESGHNYGIFEFNPTSGLDSNAIVFVPDDSALATPWQYIIDNVNIYKIDGLFQPEALTVENVYNRFLNATTKLPYTTTILNTDNPFTDGSYYAKYITFEELSETVVTYEYTPVVYDRDVSDGLDSFLTRIDMNTDLNKSLLAVAFIIIVTIIVGLLSQSGAIVILVDILLYLSFTALGWFDEWVAVLIGLGLIIVFGFKLKNGGSKDD